MKMSFSIKGCYLILKKSISIIVTFQLLVLDLQLTVASSVKLLMPLSDAPSTTTFHISKCFHFENTRGARETTSS